MSVPKGSTNCLIPSKRPAYFHPKMNTAEIKEASRNFQAKEKRRELENTKLWEVAALDAKKILNLCVCANPARVYQWGSVLHPEQFREWSDIDFALEGLPTPESLFRLQEACERTTRFPVHLVEIERLEPEYAESIRENGRLVYGC